MCQMVLLEQTLKKIPQREAKIVRNTKWHHHILLQPVEWFKGGLQAKLRRQEEKLAKDRTIAQQARDEIQEGAQHLVQLRSQLCELRR